MTTTPTSGAADLPEALRRSTAADGKTELFNLPGYPLMVRAVDFNRIHTESEMRRAALLDEMQKAALAAGQATAAPAEPDPTPGDHPQPCDSELFESGVSVGLFDIPKWTAEALCKGIAAATGARVDWHYIGGRVHVKALPAPTSAEGAAYAALPAPNYPKSGGFPGTFAEAQMRAFADATHALRASHEQAPATQQAREVSDAMVLAALQVQHPAAYGQYLRHPANGPKTSIRTEAEIDNARRMIAAALAAAPQPSTTAQAAQADSVHEDAALWHWLAEYLVGTRTDLDDEIVACETVNDLRKLVEAAIKQGATQ